MPLAVAVMADAQQPKKVPRMGFLPRRVPLMPRSASKHSGRGCGSSVILKVKNRHLNIAHGGNVEPPSELCGGTGATQGRYDCPVGVIAIRAAKKATKTIPIVMGSYCGSCCGWDCRKPGASGRECHRYCNTYRELGGRRLELLKEMVPTISRVGVLGDADAPVSAIAFKEYEAAASALKIQLQSLEVRGPNPDLEGAFQAATKGRANALITISNPLLSRYRKQIAELTIRNRTPSMCNTSAYVEAGCLMSYSSNSADQYKRAAYYVDKI